MATLQSSRAGGSSNTVSSTAATSTMTTTTVAMAVKLRDSCHACASSKLRCSKEKPTCSRCAKRGKVCEYFATRRAGRKHARKSTTRPSTVPSLPTPSPTLMQPSKGTTPASGTIQVFLDQYHGNYADSIPSPIASAETPLLSEPTPAATDMNFDDCFASPIDICVSGGPDACSHPEDYLGSWDLSYSLDPTTLWTEVPDKSTSLLDDALQVSPNHLGPQASLSMPQSAVSWQQQQGQQELNATLEGSSCDCLNQTLALLSQLFQTSTTAVSGSSSPTGGQAGASSSGRPSPCRLNGSFADSEHAIESIDTMLQCPCAQDGYLLALMSLIVFKALAWYENAARQPPGRADPADNIGKAGGLDDGNHQSRLAAQSVLGKLYRVQGLINTISQRLKARNHHGALDVASNNSLPRDRREATGGDGATLPFSAALLDQLEVDLRRRVRAVSSCVVDILRHS